MPLALGTTQAFDIFSSSGYFGFAKSTTDIFAAGAAMQHGSTSRTSADGAAITNIQGVDRTFFITVATPEPGSFVMLSVIGLAAFTRRR